MGATLIDMLSQPFMQRAFLAGIFLSVLLATPGIFVTLRKMAFFGDGIAHASLAGIAIALLLGLAPLPTALAWAIVVAVSIHFLERSTRLASDTLIGIFFTASMALGVVLMSFTRGYQPELLTYLFGSILAVRETDLMVIVGTGTLIMAWVWSSFRDLTYASLSPESAEVSGIATGRLSLSLYVALAVATVLGVKVLGIVLVSAILVLPPATSRMLTSTFRGYVIGAIVVSIFTAIVGLTASYLYDLPSGAAIILTGAAVFFLAAASRKLSSSR